MARWMVVGALLALAGCGGGRAGGGNDDAAGPQVARLPQLPIDPGAVTVSGISSGGAMAVQFHVAHSSLVRGVGVLAAPPYLCAEGSVRHALGRCMKDGTEIPTAQLVERTRQLARDGAIDPVADLADDRVWLFRGAQDPYVGKSVADSLEAYYQALVRPERVARVELPGAGHTFPTADGTAPACDVTESPFVGNCGLDGAATLLAQLHGDLVRGHCAVDRWAGRVRPASLCGAVRQRRARRPWLAVRAAGVPRRPGGQLFAARRVPRLPAGRFVRR